MMLAVSPVTVLIAYVWTLTLSKCRGHLGGLLGGVLFTYLFGPRAQVKQLGKRTQTLNAPRVSFAGPKVVREQ